MSIEFSDHAKLQLKKRKLSKTKVVDTIRHPDKKLKSFNNRRLRQKRVGGKILEVVTVSEGSRITVVTAYYLEGNSEN